MIKTALVALTVVGCDCDARLCEFISETAPRWESVEACEAAAKAEILGSRTLSYPLVSGICRPAPAASVMAGHSAERPGTNDRFDTAAPETGVYDRLASGTQVVFRRTAAGYAQARTGVASVAVRALSAVRGSADWLSAAALRF